MNTKTYPVLPRPAFSGEYLGMGQYAEGTFSAAQMHAYYDLAAARIAELEAQIEAVGAGGMQPLYQQKSTGTSAKPAQAATKSIAHGGKVTRHSDMSVLVTFPSCRQASEFERALNGCDTPAYCASVQRCTAQDEQRAAPANQAQAAINSGAAIIPKRVTPEMRRVFREAFRAGGFWADRLDYALDQMIAVAPPVAPAWAHQAVIEYRYTGGTHWCPLGPAEHMKPDFDGVYSLQGGVFPVEATPQATPAVAEQLEAAAKIAEGYPKFGDACAEEIRALAKKAQATPAQDEIERLREKVARMGLDVDRALRGEVNAESPLGATRLQAVAALAAAPHAVPADEQMRRDAECWRRVAACVDDKSIDLAGMVRSYVDALAEQKGTP